MATKYLLECSCGKKVPVVSSQADQTVRCSCGLELQVPTLLKLRHLESIEETPTRADMAESWGVAQMLMTICVLMLLLAVGWLIYVAAFTQPLTPKDFSSEEQVERAIGKMSLLDTFKVWSVLRHDIRAKRKIDQYYQAALKAYHIRLSVALVLFGLAVGATVSTWIVTRRATSQPRPDPF